MKNIAAINANLFDSLHIPLLLIKDGKIVNASKTALSFLNTDHNNLQEKTIDSVICHPEILFSEHLFSVENLEPKEVLCFTNPRFGETKWVGCKISRFEETGEILYWLELKEVVETKFNPWVAEIIVQNTKEPFIILDTDFKVLAFNHQFADISKHYIQSALVVGESVINKLHPEIAEILIGRYKRALEGYVETAEIEVEINNIVKTYETTYKPIIDSDGKVAGIFIVHTEITVIKLARLLKSVITNCYDVVIVTEAFPLVEPGPKIIFVNEAFTRLTGYTSEEVIGKSPRFLQGTKTDQFALKRMRHSLAQGLPCDITVLNYKKNGETFWANFSVSPLADQEKKITHWISIEKDVTKAVNIELEQTFLNDIGRLFSEDIAFQISLDNAIHRIAEFGQYNVSEIWLVGTGKNIIHKSAYFYDNTIANGEYYKNNSLKKIEKGNGLPGHTWKTGQTQFWFSEKGNDGCTWSVAAEQAGIVSAVSLPIIHEKEILGVMLLGYTGSQKMTSDFPLWINQLRVELGSEIRRKQLSEELDRVFRYSPGIICMGVIDGKFLKVNPALCVMLGYSELEMLQVPFMDFMHPADRRITSAILQKLGEGEGFADFENRYITKSGAVKWLSWTAAPSPEEGIFFAVAQDITEKRELENLLNKANTLAKIGSWELDMIKNTVYWSSITKEIFEVPDDYIPTLELGVQFYENVADRNIINSKISQAIQYAEPWDIELKIKTANGNYKWVRNIGDAEFVNGRCVRVFGSFQDINGIKENEIALQGTIKALKDYQFALSESTIIDFTNDKFEITYVNDNFCKISGYNAEELVGKTPKDLDRVGYEDIFFEEMWKVIHEGQVWKGEIMHHHKNGDPYWLYSTIIPFVDENQKPFQYLKISVDITEQKIADQNLLLTLNEKNTILESIGDAFFAVDKNWVVTYWNYQAEVVLGKPKNEMIGFNLWDIFIESTDSLSYHSYQKAMNTNTAINFEDYYPPLNRWYDIGAYPSESGIAVYFKDITDRKLSQQRLIDLNVRLEQHAKELAISNAELEQFAYVASHDLQEPLRMITSFLAQLDKKYSSLLDDKGRRYIEFAVDGAKRMRQIILDLLEFSRVGRQTEKAEEINLNELVEDIKILFSKQILDTNAVVAVDYLPTIKNHKAPIRQVFQNLIENALKYIHPDRQPYIHIGVREIENNLMFFVKDNGIGIDENYFHKIFVIFQRLHNKEEYSGTGLGLAVTKKIIENFGGRIWVESKEGEGAVFYFTVDKSELIKGD